MISSAQTESGLSSLISPPTSFVSPSWYTETASFSSSKEPTIATKPTVQEVDLLAEDLRSQVEQEKQLRKRKKRKVSRKKKTKKQPKRKQATKRIRKRVIRKRRAPIRRRR